MEYIFVLFVGCIAGIVTGLIGASGVMVVVPALIILGYTTSDAIGASLFIDTIASLVVAWTYYQNKNLNLKQGIWITIGSVGGAQIGSLISPSIPDVGLSSAFSILLVITAVIFWFRGAKVGVPSLNGTDAATQQSRIVKLLRSNAIVSGLLLGVLVGIISGLFGAGGGVMILLILVFVMQYSMHEGIGTSTLIMAFTAASGTLGHAISSNLPLKAAIYGAIGTLIGGRFAARFANKVNEKVLSKVIGGIFITLAVIMVVTSHLN
ncbi:MAG: sulfite exporter TauE/SafE family protein [Sphaerochaeta sp.]